MKSMIMPMIMPIITLYSLIGIRMCHPLLMRGLIVAVYPGPRRAVVALRDAQVRVADLQAVFEHMITAGHVVRGCFGGDHAGDV